MLASIIGYVLTVLFVWLSLISFVAIFTNRDPDAKIGAAVSFIIFGLLSLGTAWMVGV